MSKLIVVSFLVGLFALIAADLPVDVSEIYMRNTADVDATIYRVPDDLDPIHFEVEITPYFDEAPVGKEEFSFDGKVTINLKAAKENISSLFIQENVRRIEKVTLTDTAGVPVRVDATNPIERIRQYHFLKINLANGVTLENGREYILTIEYVGNINETPLQRGMFRGNYRDREGRIQYQFLTKIYVDLPLDCHFRNIKIHTASGFKPYFLIQNYSVPNPGTKLRTLLTKLNGTKLDSEGKKNWYAATHLQPVNSRQLFPSFDEPGFKSTFDIIVNRPINYTETFSNMPLRSSNTTGDRTREVFHTTPRMSAYLVTIHISDGFTVIADNNDTQKSYRILARPEARGQGEYALEVGPPVTAWLDNYLGVEYYSMAEHIKNDQIASAYWASGATENWGLVTYRESRLLYEEGETSALDKMYIGTITAHELAHKWFGNLITCRWWDNVWINEGFASYFEYFAMDGVDKDMELADQFNIMYVQSSLSTDSSAGTRALQHTVNSPAQVTGHFSGISYSKGASLLQMVKHYVGEETFKKALFYFLDEMKYEHAYPEDLYRAFTRAVEEDGVTIASDIAATLQYWVDEPGYPVLNVEVNMNTGLINLEQERFYISPSAPSSNQTWTLPLTYTTGNNANWEDLTVSKVMRDRTDSVTKEPGHDWVIFNVQQRGLYRVNYDTHNWEMLASALNSSFRSIHHLNRAQIVDDVFALTRSERMTYDLGFQVIDFLKRDTSYYSWYPAISGFNWLRNRFLHLPDVLSEFDEILFEYLTAVIADLGYDVIPSEPLTRTLNRFFVLSFACNIGHAGCVSNAVEKFNAFRFYGTPVNPNLRRHVFCEGLRDGGYDEWRFLFNRRQVSNNQADDVAMLRALGCTTNDQARREYMEMILDDDIVKAQDRLNAFSYLLMGDRSNAPVVLNFLKENADEIRRGVVLQTWFDSLVSNVAAYLDEDGLTEMEAWLNENQNEFPEYSVGISSINSARTSQAWGTERAQMILRAARGSAAVVLPTALLMFSALLALLLK